MISIQKCTVSKYQWDEKNSIKGESQSYHSPGHSPLIAIEIQEIIIEEKTVLLKQLKIGSTLAFKIKQMITIDVPNFKTKEYDEVEFDVTGEGSGEISELSFLDQTYPDDEYQELTIKLSKGFAEDLA